MMTFSPTTQQPVTGLPENSRLTGNEQGIAALEFGLAAPIFLAMLMAVLDLGQMALGRAVLQGAVHEAGRSSTLETADTVITDNLAKDILGLVLPHAELTTNRTSYYDFDDIERAELWNDSDGNDTCDNSEIFTDENGNGQWDADVGLDGNGSAGDVVVYEAVVTYEPIFAMPWFSHDGQRTLRASTTIKKNQPYAVQAEYGSETGTCD